MSINSRNISHLTNVLTKGVFNPVQVMHVKKLVSQHKSRCSPSWSCLRVRKPPLKVFSASCTHFWRSAHGTIGWIMNLLQSAQQLSPPTAHYHADFFPPATVDTVNGWLSQIITSAFHAGVQSDLCGSACTSQSSTQIGLFLWPALL